MAVWSAGRPLALSHSSIVTESRRDQSSIAGVGFVRTSASGKAWEQREATSEPKSTYLAVLPKRPHSGRGRRATQCSMTTITLMREAIRVMREAVRVMREASTRAVVVLDDNNYTVWATQEGNT